MKVDLLILVRFSLSVNLLDEGTTRNLGMKKFETCSYDKYALVAAMNNKLNIRYQKSSNRWVLNIYLCLYVRWTSLNIFTKYLWCMPCFIVQRFRSMCVWWSHCYKENGVLKDTGQQKTYFLCFFPFMSHFSKL